MSDNQDNLDRQKLIKQLIEGYEKELQDGEEKKDNSFVFLEKNTLHMFITFMLMLLDKQHNSDIKSDEVESSALTELSSDLELIIKDNQKAFEELIHVLKKT